MNATHRRGVGLAVAVGLVLIAVGLLGYDVEGSARRSRPDGVGYGLPWSHELHARHPDYSCQTCHHKSRPGQTRLQACGACHPTSPDLGQPQPPPSKAGDRRAALHASCVGCHKAVDHGPTRCDECHEPGHGTAFCATCHESTLEELVAGGHAGVACESCHSSNARRLEHDRHVSAVPSASDREQCLACHGDAERDAAGMPVKRASECPARDRAPAGDRGCLGCHPPHSPRAKRR